MIARIDRLNVSSAFPWLFLASWLAVLAVSWLALSQQTNQATLEVAVTLDLTLFIPALYWLILVRGRGWPLLSILPVFLASLGLASLILPEGRQASLQIIKYLAAPAELALVSVLVHRATRAVRLGRAHESHDVLERVRAAVHDVIASGKAAEIVAFETAVLWYALFSWRTATPASDPRSFTYHKKTGYGAVVAAILLAMAVELIPIHMLLAHWSAPLAWIVTALSLYGALWLIGDCRALLLRPITLQGDQLVIRFGLRWNLSIPLAAVEGVEARRGSLKRNPVDLRLALPGSRVIAIRLREPLDALGPYGMHRTVQTLELGVDDPDHLTAALTSSV
jgi:hypothetical protein